MTDLFGESRLYVDGTLRDARDGRTFEDRNPATEAVIGVAAEGGAADVDEAIGAARRAFDESDWSTDLDLRLRCVNQLRDALHAHREELRATTVAETGSPVGFTRFAQLDTPLDDLDWVLELAASYEWERPLPERRVFGASSVPVVRREPRGVVAAITPWNFPNQINLAKVFPALLAGNTVVLKPAPDTPWLGLVIGRLAAEETDLPAGVLNVVTTSDDAVASRLVTDDRVDMVTFTGSTATGRRIMATAAATVKQVFLELGGKSACVVLDDADVAEAAAGAAFAVCAHAGQGCAIQTRLVVPRARVDEAVEAATSTLTAVQYGDPTDPDIWMGPVISERQRDRVLGYVERGADEGATVATGGGRPTHLERGWFVEPTLLTGVDRRATVAQEEIFGPVLVMIAHDGDDDAVAIANDSIYGLSGGVHGSPDRALAVARRIRTGTISVNGAQWYSPDVPFGGYRQSGIGREMGVPGFEEYLETKAIAVPGPDLRTG